MQTIVFREEGEGPMIMSNGAYMSFVHARWGWNVSGCHVL